MSSKSILVIGSLNTDLIIDVDTLPLIGETVLGDNLVYAQGGKGANQAFAAARAGGNVVMLGSVGADDFGKMQRANLEAAGVDVSKIHICDNSPTGTAVINVDKNGNNTIIVVPGANKSCTVDYLKKNSKAFQSGDFIMIQMEIPWESISYALSKGHELGKTVIFDPAPISEPLPDDFYPLIDYITPNEVELMKLVGVTVTSVKEAELGAKALLDKGVKNVVVTMGETGALYVTNTSSQLFPAKKVSAVDTTAAGDCFNAAFVVALAEDMDVCKAIEFANAASSISVSVKGAQPSIPTRAQIESRLFS